MMSFEKIKKICATIKDFYSDIGKRAGGCAYIPPNCLSTPSTSSSPKNEKQNLANDSTENPPQSSASKTNNTNSQ